VVAKNVNTGAQGQASSNSVQQGSFVRANPQYGDELFDPNGSNEHDPHDVKSS